MTDTRREEIAMAIGFASRHKFDASKDAAEFWEYISGEGREWYLRMADAVLPIVTPAPVAGWRGIPISTNERLPEKPGKRSYEHVRCLIFIHGKWEVGMWNCEHLVWDDDEGDDFRYHPTEPTHWMPLPPAPGTQPATEQPSVKEAAVDALASYQQADADGIMVLVSRQAIEECLPALRSLAQGDE